MTDDTPAVTPLQKLERQAMLGDRAAVLRLVSAVRGFRQLLEVIEAEYEAKGESFFEHSQACQEIEGDGDKEWWR